MYKHDVNDVTVSYSGHITSVIRMALLREAMLGLKCEFLLRLTKKQKLLQNILFIVRKKFLARGKMHKHFQKRII